MAGDNRGTPPAWAVRVRAERKARGWDVGTMARSLRQAAGEHGRDLPSHGDIVRSIRHWESGATLMPSERYRLLYGRAMGIPEAILFAPERTLSPFDGTADNEGRSAEEAGDPTNRRDVFRVGLAAALGRVLGEAADEAMEFTRRAGQSAVGRSTLDHLEVVITDIVVNSRRSSPTDVFTVARAYRHRVDQLIRSPHTLREGRELYVYAGWLSQELAWLAHATGDPVAANAYAVDALEHAHQAGHDELYAHAANALISISIQADRPDRALSAARRGLARVPEGHALAVWLNAQAARAHAQLGQRAECESSLRTAESVYERLPSRSAGRFGSDNDASAAAPAIPRCAAAAWLTLGDFDRARRNAENAVAVYEARPAGKSMPGAEASTRLYLGIALAYLGSPEEALALGTRGLDSPRITAPIRSRATQLDQVLTKRYPGVSGVSDFHERRLALAK
ncbi:hypothetical protein AB0395_23025 [Streptosporangium sp. NPDC051023]|uniref:hypothetical protein n=1 Tax=Streptosporangium sp. NPDC051023 TaxID=3155410 RepID=UPI0034510696